MVETSIKLNGLLNQYKMYSIAKYIYMSYK